MTDKVNSETIAEKAAEDAYAAAAAEVKAVVPETVVPETVVPEPVAVEPVAVPAKVAPVKTAPVSKAPAKAAPAKPAPVKSVPVKSVPVKSAPVKLAKSVKPAAVPAPKEKTTKPSRKPKVATRRRIVPPRKPPAKIAATSNLSVTELKEKIMATKNTAFSGELPQMMSKSMTDAVAEMQTKAQTAYDKGTTMVADMTDLAKGNAEAVVESGKILAAGLQDLGKSYAEDAKFSYETLTADFKEMAAVKSPTELFQLQGKIMRRNFDAMVAASSKGTETGMKLANEVIAPLSARVNLAVAKLSKAA